MKNELVTKVDDQKIYDLMDDVNNKDYTKETVKNMIKSLFPAQDIPNVVVIGEYIISRMKNGEVWVQHKAGEGMQISHEKMTPYIKQCFDDNF